LLLPSPNRYNLSKAEGFQQVVKMNSKLIAACAVVFLAIVFGFSSNQAKAENFISAGDSRKCAIPAFKDAFGASSAVFVGKVKSEKKTGDVRVFEFEVEKYWKGSKKKKVKISVYETTRFQAWFKVGEKYLVYAAGGEDGTLHVGRCSRSRDAGEASEDLQKLGEGKRPK
jgi:hypothetical protein